MTEYEINDLIIGQATVMNQCFQVWAVATTSLVVAAYMVGSKLESGLRWMLLVVYLLLALTSIGAWSNCLYVMVRLTQRMVDAGMPLVEQMPFVAEAIPLVWLIGFLVGTVGSIAYMIKTGREKNP
jgi:hypothetical protein